MEFRRISGPVSRDTFTLEGMGRGDTGHIDFLLKRLSFRLGHIKQTFRTKQLTDGALFVHVFYGRPLLLGVPFVSSNVKMSPK